MAGHLDVGLIDEPPQDSALTGTGSAVTATLTLSPATLPAAPVGTPVTQQITAAGGMAPYRFLVTSGSLPPGLSLNPDTGVMSGTPATVGSYRLTITATDSSPSRHSGSRAYTLQITPPAVTLALAPATLPAAPVGTPVTQQITAAGGMAP
ncbi:MAG TPA: cadherin repeat domain-containing protein, partial [Streptosporangiaceae bacterium]